MKNFLLSALACAISFFVSAQIPNAGFEQWDSNTVGQFRVYQAAGWSGSEVMDGFSHLPPSVTRTSDAHSGQSAVKLVNQFNTFNMSAYLGSQSYNDGDSTSEKFPISGRPAKFEGWFKYDYTEADTAQVIVLLYHDSLNMGYALFSVDHKQSSYQKFSIPIEYYDTSAPTHAAIYMNAGSPSKFKDGSTFYLDDLALTAGATAIPEPKSTTFYATVSPNPVTDIAVLNYEQKRKGMLSAGVYDLSGNLVQVPFDARYMNAGMNRIAWDAGSLPAGMYMLRIVQDGAMQTLKLIRQ